jgi:hypothetical protein
MLGRENGPEHRSPIRAYSRERDRSLKRSTEDVREARFIDAFLTHPFADDDIDLLIEFVDVFELLIDHLNAILETVASNEFFGQITHRGACIDRIHKSSTSFRSEQTEDARTGANIKYDLVASHTVVLSLSLSLFLSSNTLS